MNNSLNALFNQKIYKSIYSSNMPILKNMILEKIKQYNTFHHLVLINKSIEVKQG